MALKKSQKTIFSCENCGSQFPKWLGQCPECGKWGTIKEEVFKEPDRREISGQAQTLKSFAALAGKDLIRIKTGLKEFDRVMGGGVVPGSLILLSGEPGIGKSTLILQMIQLLDLSSVYVSGEESPEQIKLRADRLGIKMDKVKMLSETNIENVIATLAKEKPSLAVIDSIQTVFFESLPSEAGSQNQVRVCTVKLLALAKKNNMTIVIIGHVTKEGVVAGPKAMEHLVDTVLYLEGDKYHAFRILRTPKNRFGSTNEVGVFDMQSAGLIEVKNPSEVFLSERQASPGSCVACMLEGTRPFLVEVQALVNQTVFGLPRRTTNGYDFNRLLLLAAVLGKRCGLHLGNQDIYLNIVGGLKISEPAIDLAACLAIASAYKNKLIPQDLVAIGEVGLGGEVRLVSRLEQRLSEAAKLGFKVAVISVNARVSGGKLNLIKVKNVSEAVTQILR